MKQMDFNEKLLMLRKNKNITQEELAEKLNVSRQAVSKWESGVCLPETEKIIELSKLYDISLDYLLLGKEKEPAEKEIDYDKYISPQFEHLKKFYKSNKPLYEKAAGVVFVAISLIGVLILYILYILNPVIENSSELSFFGFIRYYKIIPIFVLLCISAFSGLFLISKRFLKRKRK